MPYPICQAAAEAEFPQCQRILRQVPQQEAGGGRHPSEGHPRLQGGGGQDQCLQAQLPTNCRTAHSVPPQ